jgi:hypothetical protein
MQRLVIAFALGLAAGLLPSPPARGEHALCESLRGARIVAQDAAGTYLGKIAARSDSDSIFNRFGPYGDKFGGKSIWNEFGAYGNAFQPDSAFNPLATKPPKVMKGEQVLIYLTVNEGIANGLSPAMLKAVCESEF